MTELVSSHVYAKFLELTLKYRDAVRWVASAELHNDDLDGAKQREAVAYNDLAEYIRGYMANVSDLVRTTVELAKRAQMSFGTIADVASVTQSPQLPPSEVAK